MRSLPYLPRAGAVLAGVGALLGCGRINFSGTDAGPLDATAVDAVSLDATSLDATGLDATGLDAASPDATTLDARAEDAQRDAGRACRATITWLDGPGIDGIDAGEATSDGALLVYGQMSAPDLLPGWPAAAATVRLSGTTVEWSRSHRVQDFADDGADLLVLTETEVERLDPATGALRSTLGTFTGLMSGSRIEHDGAGGAVMALNTNGVVTWRGTEISPPGTISHTTVLAVDATGAIQSAVSGGSPDTDVVQAMVPSGGAFYTVGFSNGSTFCLGAAGCTASRDGFAIRIDGAPLAPSGFLPALVNATYSLITDARSNLFGAMSVLTSVTSSGTVRFTHPSPVFPLLAYDAANDLVVMAGRLVMPLTFGARTVEPLGAAQTLVVLWFDPTSGELVDELRFGGDGIYYPQDVAVLGDSSVAVVGYTSDLFAACPGEPTPPPVGASAAFILRAHR